MNRLYTVYSRNRRNIKIWISAVIFITLMLNLLDLREITIQNYIVSFKQESGRTIVSQNQRMEVDVKNAKDIKSDINSRYVDAIEVILNGKFKTPESVNSPSNGFINRNDYHQPE